MTRLLALGAALLLCSTAAAHQLTVGNLEIIHPHIPLPGPRAQVAAGYLAISNDGTETDRLLGITSGIAKSSTLHQSRIDANGVASMTPVTALEIPPGETVLLEPGGLHIMFMGLTGSHAEGDMVPVTLTFERAGTVGMEFMIDPPNGAAGAHDHTAPKTGD